MLPRRRAARTVRLLAATALVGLLAACGGATGRSAPGSGSASESASAPGSGSASASASAGAAIQQVQGRVGQLVIGDGFVPEPASPDVAAAYLTIVNDGSTTARLTAASSGAAARVMPMTEKVSGTVGGMAPLDTVVVPAHGVFRFRPGAAHLMLEQPDPVPAAGGTVPLTLTFDPGGAVTISLPVTQTGAQPPAAPMP